MIFPVSLLINPLVPPRNNLLLLSQIDFEIVFFQKKEGVKVRWKKKKDII